MPQPLAWQADSSPRVDDDLSSSTSSLAPRGLWVTSKKTKMLIVFGITLAIIFAVLTGILVYQKDQVEAGQHAAASTGASSAPQAIKTTSISEADDRHAHEMVASALKMPAVEETPAPTPSPTAAASAGSRSAAKTVASSPAATTTGTQQAPAATDATGGGLDLLGKLWSMWGGGASNGNGRRLSYGPRRRTV